MCRRRCRRPSQQTNPHRNTRKLACWPRNWRISGPLTAHRSSPPLTTIRQGLFEQGSTSAALALALVAGDVTQVDDFPTELVIRASTTPPAGVAKDGPIAS